MLVAFDDGEFDHPYVVGFLWNGEQTSPEQAPDNRVIVTPGGHQLRFEDKEGDKRIVLKTSEHMLTLEDKTAEAARLKSTQRNVRDDSRASRSPSAARRRGHPQHQLIDAAANAHRRSGPAPRVADDALGGHASNCSPAEHHRRRRRPNLRPRSSTSPPAAMFSGAVIASAVVAKPSWARSTRRASATSLDWHA